jgi:hypothetical protein
MVHLPAEILHQILSELYHGKEYIRIAPLATVNRHWQGVVEGILWRRFSISVSDVMTFNAHFQAIPERRQHLRILLYSLDGYFRNPFIKKETSSVEDSNESSDGEYEEDEQDKEHGNYDDEEEHGEESVPVNEQDGQDWDSLNEGVIFTRFLAFQKEHFRFFEELKLLWDVLASWEEALSVTSIKLFITAQCIYTLLGPAFRDADIVREYLSDNMWLNSPCLAQLPLFLSVKKLKLELDLSRQPAAAVWPQVVACKLASTLPALDTLETSQDNDLDWRWYHARKYFRECKCICFLFARSVLH